MARAKYVIESVTIHFIYLVDLQQECSITNDAEAVVKEVVERWGDKRILYWDSMDNQDELCHQKGIFTHFAPGIQRKVG